jgi:hypothetical protein
MKTTIIIFTTITICSCSTYKIYDLTDHNLDKKMIVNELKKQNSKIKIMDIIEVDKYYEASFILDVKKWKDVKAKSWKSSVKCTILKTSDCIYINTYYIDGILRNGFDENVVNKYIESSIQLFRQGNDKVLEKTILDKIENGFRTGVEINYGGSRTHPLRY